MAPQPNANGNWFYNKDTGQIQHITNFLEKAVFEAEPWEISFSTQSDALAFKAQYEAHKKDPASANPLKEWWLNPEDGTIFHGQAGQMGAPWMPFSSQAEAEAYLKKHPATSGFNKAISAVGNTVTGAGDALSGITGFLSKLTQPVFWLRILEVLIGGSMVIIGFGKMAGMGHDVPTIAKTAAKAAFL